MRSMKNIKRSTVKIGRVAKYMRVVVFRDRDRVYSRRLKRFTNRFDKWHWVAGDVTSYHLGIGKDPVQAVQSLIHQVQWTRLMIADERAKGVKVICWRCNLPPKEAAEWERKAKETGFVLEHVAIQRFPKSWDRLIGKMRYKTVYPKKKGRAS